MAQFSVDVCVSVHDDKGRSTGIKYRCPRAKFFNSEDVADFLANAQGNGKYAFANVWSSDFREASGFFNNAAYVAQQFPKIPRGAMGTISATLPLASQTAGFHWNPDSATDQPPARLTASHKTHGQNN